MSVEIKYKGNTIASANTDTTKTIKTSGKYCEADIEVINTQDGGITPTGSVTLTEENTYDVTDKAQAIVDFSATRANLAEAVTAKGVDTLPTSSFDTIATNIGLISGGGGLPTSIAKIDGGSFTISVDTNTNQYPISHNLGEMPKGYAIWAEIPPEAVAGTQNYFIGAMLNGETFQNAEGGTQFYAKNGSSTYRAKNGSFQTNKLDILSTALPNYFTTNQIKQPFNIMLKADTTYRWIAWA